MATNFQDQVLFKGEKPTTPEPQSRTSNSFDFAPQRAIKLSRELSEPDLIKQMLKLGESIARKGQKIQSVQGPFNHDEDGTQMYILDLAIVNHES